MKIPLVQPVNVGVSYPARGGGNAGLVAAAGAGVVQATEAIAGAIEQRRIAESKSEAVLLQSQFEVAARQHDAALRATITDPDEYEQKRTEGLQKIRDTINGQAKGAYTTRILADRLAPVLGDMQEKAIGHAAEIRRSQAVARFDTLRSNVDTLSAVTPWDDAKEQGRLWGLVAGESANVERYIGADKAGDLRRTARKEFVKGIALRHIEDSPSSFLDNSDQYAELGSTVVSELRGKAETRRDHLNTQAIEADKRREAYFKEQLKADQDALVSDFDKRLIAARNSPSAEADRLEILRDLNLRTELRQIPEPHARRLLEEATNPKSAPSDRAIRDRIGLDVQGPNPRTTFEEIDRYNERFNKGLPGLNYEDSVKAKSDLRATLLANKNEATQAKLREHQQAEQELRAYLGIRPGMIQQMTENINTNDPISRLYAAGLAQLRARSYAYNEQGESPIAVVDQIGPRFQQKAGVSRELQAQTIRDTLPAPTREALAQMNREGKIGRAEYLYALRQFNRLDELVGPQQPTTPTPRPTVAPRLGEKK